MDSEKQIIRILINGRTERCENAYEFVRESLRDFQKKYKLYFVYFGSLPLGMESSVNDLLIDTNHIFLVIDPNTKNNVESKNEVYQNVIYVNSYFVIDDMIVLNHSFFAVHEEIYLFNILENMKSIAISTVPLDIWEDGRAQEYTSSYESLEILYKSIVQLHLNKIKKNNNISIIYYTNFEDNLVHTVKIDNTTYSEIKEFTYE